MKSAAQKKLKTIFHWPKRCESVPGLACDRCMIGKLIASC